MTLKAYSHVILLIFVMYEFLINFYRHKDHKSNTSIRNIVNTSS